MSDLHKNRLLEEFQAYLDQADLSQAVSDEQPDLNTLLSEMAGLKSEVKAQSRHFKSTLDTLSETLTSVQADNKALSAALEANSAGFQQLRNETLRSVLLDMVDIYDRLTTGFNVLQNYNPASGLFGHSKKQDVNFIDSFKEGQAMTLKRFEQLLQTYNVYPIECVGKPLDPHTMRAVEIGQNTKLDNGTVLEELRKGFLLEDQVLRLAEVKVNKI